MDSQDSHILAIYLEVDNEIFGLNMENFDILDDCRAMLDLIDKQTVIINELEDKNNEDLAIGGATFDTYFAMHNLIQVSEMFAESNEATSSLQNMSSNDSLLDKLKKSEENLIAQLQAKKEQFDESDLGRDFKEIQSRVTSLDDTIVQLDERKLNTQDHYDQMQADDENETLRKSNEISELVEVIADQESRHNHLVKEKESKAEHYRQLTKQTQDFFAKFISHYDPEALMQSWKVQPVIPLLANSDKLRPVQFDRSPMKDLQPSKISSQNPSTDSLSEVENSSRKPSGIRFVLPVTDYTVRSSQVKQTETDDLSVLKTSSQKSNSSRDSNTSKKSFLETVYNWPGSQELKLPAGSQKDKQMIKPKFTSGSHPVQPGTDYAMGSSQMKPTETDDLPVLKVSIKSSSQKSNSSRGNNTLKKSLGNVFDWPRSQEGENQMKKSEEMMMQKPEIKQAVQYQVDNISTGEKMKISPRSEVKRISVPMTCEKSVKEDAQPKPKKIPEGKKITILSDVTIKAKSTTPPIKSPSDTSLQESEMNFDMMDDFGNDMTSEIAESESAFLMGGGSSAAAFDAFGDQQKSPGSGFGW